MLTQSRMRTVCQAALEVRVGLEDSILVGTDVPLSFAAVLLTRSTQSAIFGD